MVRVLNVVSTLNNAGTEASIMNYYRNIDRNKVQFDFLVLDESPNTFYEEEIQKLGGIVYKIPSFLSNPIKNKKLRKEIIKKYQIIEVHSMHVLRYGYCKDAKKLKIKNIIFHIHNANKSNGILERIGRKQIIKNSTSIVGCSKYALETSLKCDGKIIPNAIDYDKYKFSLTLKEKVKKYYGLSDNKKIIGNIGRFGVQKNQLFLLSVFADALKENVDLVLMLKGFGEKEQEIKDFIKTNNLCDNVIVVGNEFTADQIYNAFDVFALPSLYEGLPVVGIEAQANGLKVLFSDTITKEVDISKQNKFLELTKDVWIKEILNTNNYLRIDKENFDFLKTEYNIKIAAPKRQNEYLEMIEEND